MRTWTCTVAAVLLFGLAWFGRAAWGGHFLVDESPGMDIYHLSTIYERWAHYWSDGRVPSWMPEFAGGFPAPASWMYGLLYPGPALFAVLPADAAWTWTALLHLALGAVGVQRLVRAETGDSVAGATAGVLFGVSELMIGRVLFGHLNVMMPIAWAPWVFVHLRGITDGRRGAAGWLVLCASLGLVSGHVQVWFYVVPAALAYATTLVVAAPERGRVLRALGTAAVLVGLVTAAQWLPTLELFGLSQRAAESTTDVAAFCAPAGILVAKLFPGALGHLPDTYWGPVPAVHEMGAIGGLIVVALAAPALLRPRRDDWTWLGIAAAGLLLAPGVLNPVSSLLNDLPPFRFGRTPARALLLTTLAGAVLAGRGLAALRRASEGDGIALRGLVRSSATVTAAVAVVGVGGLVLTVGTVGHASLVGRAVVTSGVLAAAALTVAVLARTRPVLWSALPVLALVAAAAGGVQPARSVGSDFYFTDWRTLLPAELQEHRIHLADNRFPNVERQGMRTLREICYVDARWYHAFMANPGPGRGPWLDVGADMAGIPREVLMSGSIGPEDIQGRPLRTPGPGQVFTAARVETDDGPVIAALDAGERALYLAAPADGAGVGPSRAVDAAQVRRVDGGSPTETRFDVDSPVAGWLIVSEKHYPGWTATVNGEAAEVHRANVMFRAVPVPQGRSTVVFTYASNAVRAGALLSLAGIALTLVLAFRARRAA